MKFFNKKRRLYLIWIPSIIFCLIGLIIILLSIFGLGKLAMYCPSDSLNVNIFNGTFFEIIKIGKDEYLNYKITSCSIKFGKIDKCIKSYAIIKYIGQVYQKNEILYKDCNFDNYNNNYIPVSFEKIKTVYAFQIMIFIILMFLFGFISIYGVLGDYFSSSSK